MTQDKTNPPSLSPIEAATAVLGQKPREAILYVEIGSDTLDQLGALFLAIGLLHEKCNSSTEIKHLVSLGRYITSDIGNLIGAEYDKMVEAIEAAEAQEVEA